MNPFETLEISIDATDAEVRQAYLDKLKRFSPDKDPAGFERLRAAYQAVDTEENRIAASLEWLFEAPEKADIVSRFAQNGRHCAVGPKLWLDLIKAGHSK